ncbi:MAG: hypothetical protein ACE5K3_00990 [bacterium]
MICKVKAEKVEVQVVMGKPAELKFSELTGSRNKARVTMDYIGLVGLELQLKEAIDELGLDREKLLKHVNLTYADPKKRIKDS